MHISANTVFIYIHEIVYIHRKTIRCFLSSFFSVKKKGPKL